MLITTLLVMLLDSPELELSEGVDLPLLQLSRLGYSQSPSPSSSSLKTFKVSLGMLIFLLSVLTTSQKQLQVQLPKCCQ